MAPASLLARKYGGHPALKPSIWCPLVKSLITISPELRMKVLIPSDAGPLFALVHRNREHLRQWLPWVDATKGAEDTRGFLGGAYEAFKEDLAAHFGIRLNGQLVGIVGFHGFDRTNRVTSLGYWLARDYCRRGIMRKCVAAAVEFAIREEGMNRVYVRCATGNHASKRIPQSLGFRFEGIQREAEWLYDHFLDLEVYSMLAREWTGAAGRIVRPDQGKVRRIQLRSSSSS